MQARVNQVKSDFVDKPLVRASLFAITFVLATLFIFGAESFLVYAFILFFPSGLISVLTQNFTDPSMGAIIFGWMVYIGIALLGILTKNRKIFVRIYLIFVILLIVNIAGCNLIVQNASLRF